MSTNCYNGTSLPTPLQENCDGVYTSDECAVHPAAIVYLNLPINSSLYTIVNTIVLSLMSKDNEIAALQEIVVDLQNQIDNL